MNIVEKKLNKRLKLMKEDKRKINEDYVNGNGELCDLDRSKVYKGLVGIKVDTSRISYIDGEQGMLFYRGYPVKELCDQSTFEEVAYLLIYGDLPTTNQLEEFKSKLIKERDIPDNILAILKSFPRNTTRIELLRTAVSALSLYDPDDYDYSEPANIRKGLRIIAKMPTLLAYAHRIQTNLPLIEPSKDLSHAANYYYMMVGKKPDKAFEMAFDDVLICHADHGMNSSTFSCRVTVSTLSDLYSGITSAIGTLRGPLHGGANEAVMKYMINEVKRTENVIPWADGKFGRKEKIMGFGHRVYKTWDPRALILRQMAKMLIKSHIKGKPADKIPSEDIHEDVDFIFDMTEKLTNHVIKTKGIYPNVDLYSAGVLHMLGIPTPSFTPLFAAARSVGWVANAIEQLADNKLIRPRLLYTGDLNKEFIPIDQR